MPEELIMRGKTASGETDTLNFGGQTPGYAYRMTQFQIWPSTEIGSTNQELSATVTAAKTYEDPVNPDFSNAGLIAVAMKTIREDSISIEIQDYNSIVNDTFLITQDLIIAVIDTKAGTPKAVNWQCRFKKVKLCQSAEAVANFNQFTIYDG